MELASSVWTDAELDESILKLCDEFPHAPMVACSRAVERCRRSPHRGTPDVLLAAMRGALQEETMIQAPSPAGAARLQ